MPPCSSASCFAGFQKHVALTSPEDTFALTLRKMSSVILCSLGLVALWSAANVARALAGGFVNASSIISLLVSVVWMTVFSGNYILLRMNKGKFYEFQIDFVLWVLTIGWLFAMLTNPEFEPVTGAGIVAMLVAMCQARTFWPQATLLFFASLLTIYTEVTWLSDYPSQPEQVVPVIPGTETIGFFSLVSVKVFALLVYTVTILGVKAQASMFEVHLTANQKVNEMATKVTEHLARYNTEQARDTLDQYGGELGLSLTTLEKSMSMSFAKSKNLIADEGRDGEKDTNSTDDLRPGSPSKKDAGAFGGTERLVMAMIKMNDNLEQYKAFLPNYLFLDEDDDDESQSRPAAKSGGVGRAQEDYDPDDEGSIGGFSGQSGQSPAMVALETTEQQNKNNNTSSSRQNSARGYMKNSRSPYTTQLITPGGGGGVGDSGSQKSGRSVLSALSAAVANPQVGIASHPHDGGGFKGKIATVLVDITASTVAASLRLSSHATGSNIPLPDLLDLIFITAQNTKGSVHTMLGDRAHLTWNATHRVAMPEAKACTFVLKLKDRISDLLGLASCQSDSLSLGGTGNNHHFATLAATAAATTSSPNTARCPINGSVVSGTATVHAVMAKKARQQALVIDGDWLPVMEGCFKLASRYGTIITEEYTQRVATYNVETRPVDRIQFLPRAFSRKISLLVPKGSDQDTPWHPGFVFECDEAAATSSSGAVPSPTTPVPPPTTNTTTNSHYISNSKTHFSVQKRMVYELLREVKTKEDEWMYQLEEKEQGVSGFDAAYTKGFELAMCEGKVEEAWSTLLAHDPTLAETKGSGVQPQPPTPSSIPIDPPRKDASSPALLGGNISPPLSNSTPKDGGVNIISGDAGAANTNTTGTKNPPALVSLQVPTFLGATRKHQSNNSSSDALEFSGDGSPIINGLPELQSRWVSWLKNKV